MNPKDAELLLEELATLKRHRTGLRVALLGTKTLLGLLADRVPVASDEAGHIRRTISLANAVLEDVNEDCDG